MAEQKILEEITKKKRKNAGQDWVESNNKNIFDSLNNSRSSWQVFVDWVHRDKIGSWCFAIFGSLLFLIPPILVAVASFNKHSDQLENDFFVPLKSRYSLEYFEKEGKKNIEDALNAMDQSMRAQANQILDQQKQAIDNTDCLSSLAQKAHARIAGILEDAPDGFPLKKRFLDPERIPLFEKDSLRFRGASGGICLTLKSFDDSAASSRSDVDFFIKFIQQIFRVNLKREDQDMVRHQSISSDPGYSYCEITSENLGKILGIEIAEAKNKAKPLYESWKKEEALKSEIKNWVGGDEERQKIVNRVLKGLMIEKLAEDSWVGKCKIETIGITAVGKECQKQTKKDHEKEKKKQKQYEEFANYFNTHFGNDACSLDYKSELVAHNDGLQNETRITLTFNIDLILKNNKTVSASSSVSSLITAISTSAQSQTQSSTPSASASTGQSEQPKSEGESKPSVSLNPT